MRKRSTPDHRTIPSQNWMFLGSDNGGKAAAIELPIFPTSRSERLAHGLVCLFILPGCVFLFVMFSTLKGLQGFVANAIVFLLQDMFLALAIYSAFALTWCLFMPEWLERMAPKIKSNMMFAFLLFTISSCLLFLGIAITKFVGG